MNPSGWTGEGARWLLFDPGSGCRKADRSSLEAKAVVPSCEIPVKPRAVTSATVIVNVADTKGHSDWFAQSGRCSDDWREFGILTASTRNGDEVKI